MKITLFTILFIQTLGKDDSLESRLIQGLKTMKASDKRVLPGGKKMDKKGKHAPIYNTCTLCYGGARFSNADTLIPDINVTCSEADAYLRELINATDPFCAGAQETLGELCGCSTCPGVCPNGDAVGYPDRIIPYDVDEDGSYDDTCSDLNLAIPNDPNGNSACIQGAYASQYCGCKSYKPICTPCANNDVMPNYNKIIFDDSNATCGYLAYSIAMLADPKSDICTMIGQSYYGAIFCDCPSLPKSVQSDCSICKPDETLSSSLEPVFPDEAPFTCRGFNALAEFSGATDGSGSCEEANMLMELLENYTSYGRATCCTPKNPKQGKSKKGGKAAAKGDAGPALGALKKKLKMMMKK